MFGKLFIARWVLSASFFSTEPMYLEKLISKLYKNLNFISFEILELSKSKMNSWSMSDNGT
jgi:hypothetical protein